MNIFEVISFHRRVSHDLNAHHVFRMNLLNQPRKQCTWGLLVQIHESLFYLLNKQNENGDTNLVSAYVALIAGLSKGGNANVHVS